MGRGEESCRKMAASGSYELKGLERVPEAEELVRGERQNRGCHHSCAPHAWVAVQK